MRVASTCFPLFTVTVRTTLLPLQVGGNVLFVGCKKEFERTIRAPECAIQVDEIGIDVIYPHSLGKLQSSSSNQFNPYGPSAKKGLVVRASSFEESFWNGVHDLRQESTLPTGPPQ